MQSSSLAKMLASLCGLAFLPFVPSCSKEQTDNADVKPELVFHFRLSKAGVIRTSASSRSSLPLVPGRRTVSEASSVLETIFGEGTLKDVPIGYGYFDPACKTEGKALVWWSRDEAADDWLLNWENTHQGNIKIELTVERPDGTTTNSLFRLPQGTSKRSCWRN